MPEGMSNMYNRHPRSPQAFQATCSVAARPLPHARAPHAVDGRSFDPAPKPLRRRESTDTLLTLSPRFPHFNLQGIFWRRIHLFKRLSPRLALLWVLVEGGLAHGRLLVRDVRATSSANEERGRRERVAERGGGRQRSAGEGRVARGRRDSPRHGVRSMRSAQIVCRSSCSSGADS